MAVKLLRCSGQWVKLKSHPCWKVEKALQDMGIDYERVNLPVESQQARRHHRRHGAEKVPGDPVRGRERLPRGVEGYGGDDPCGQVDGEGARGTRRNVWLDFLPTPGL